MFNPTQLVIDTYVERLKENYTEVYGKLEPEFPGIIGFCAHMALETIAGSDAAYHDINHTILVTDVGQCILRGKQLSRGGVSPKDWMHFVISLLFHDIGYVRGCCRADTSSEFAIDFEGNTTQLPPGATDASLTRYHVTRSQLFVRERFARAQLINPKEVEANIELTRFPVPETSDYQVTNTYPALVRAADLIGQMADLDYLRKCAALYREFEETGASKLMGYQSAADLRTGYPKFFWNMVRPLIGDALDYLQKTQEGRIWVNGLYANVFIEEHQMRGTAIPIHIDQGMLPG